MLQELNATQFNITGTRVTEPIFDGLGTGQSRAESKDTDRSKEQLKGHEGFAGRVN